MSAQQPCHGKIDRLTLRRFGRGIQEFVASETGGKAKTLGVSLLLLMLTINGLNVVNSYVGRDFITAIENRSMSGFLGEAGLYILVFIASTIAAVVFRYCEESLGLVWREWLTKRLLQRYLANRNYYHLHAAGLVANPDQRIADDVKAFTVTTLSFTLMFLNGTFTVLAFSGVLWSISPLLFVAAILYAGIGSYASYYLGRSLVELDYNQFDKEANFRSELIHVGENAESVALLHREERLKVRLLHRLDELTANFRKIIKVHRNLGYYTTWYNYLAQIVPALVVAPLFIWGNINEFGVITQSAMAFTHLLGAFSLIVTNFQSITTFTAVIARLGTLEQALEPAEGGHTGGTAVETAAVPSSAIEIREEDRGQVSFHELTLLSPHDGRPLLNKLSLTVPSGTRLLISGNNEDAKVALFRATAGIWHSGHGQIVRPPFGHIYFLPERPYLPAVTLRELLVRTGHEQEISDEIILTDLHALNLEQILARVDDLDTPYDWKNLLSLDEQQMLAFLRLFLAKPRFAFLERIGHALGPDEVDKVLHLLSQRSITYLTTGRHGKREKDDKISNYDVVLELDTLLELQRGGNWNVSTVQNGQLVVQRG
jgi:putative ATP-binding cassette transporter